MTTVRVLLQCLDPDLPGPSQANPGDAGWDLRARFDVTIPPGERRLVQTGVAIALPRGWVGLIHPRSGLALRDGFTIANAPGTIDAGFRGEISVIGLNTDIDNVCNLRRGDRIAQLIVQQVVNVVFDEVQELPGSVRDEIGRAHV